MIRLLIDAGNTNVKLALVDDERWLMSSAFPVHQPLDLAVVDGFDVQQIIVSNVAGAEVGQRIVDGCAVRRWIPRFIEAQSEQCGVRNGYVHPEQLGSDRWAALIAAWHLCGRACLVVSSGTATTIDALSDRGEFMGGLILPGIELMRRSLAGATANLQSGGGVYDRFPRNTADALQSGAIQAICGAIERQHALMGGGVPVLICGGAAQVLTPHLDFAVRRVDALVLQGLLLIARSEI